MKSVLGYILGMSSSNKIIICSLSYIVFSFIISQASVFVLPLTNTLLLLNFLSLISTNDILFFIFLLSIIEAFYYSTLGLLRLLVIGLPFSNISFFLILKELRLALTSPLPCWSPYFHLPIYVSPLDQLIFPNPCRLSFLNYP